MGLPQHRRRPSHCSQGSEMKQSIKIKHLDLFFFLQSSEMTLNLNPPLAPQLTSRPTKKMQTKSLTSKTQLLDYRKTLPNFTAQPDLCCSNLYSLSTFQGVSESYSCLSRESKGLLHFVQMLQLFCCNKAQHYRGRKELAQTLGSHQLRSYTKHF